MKRRYCMILMLIILVTPTWAIGNMEILPTVGMKRIEASLTESIKDGGSVEIDTVAAAVNIFRDSSADTITAVLTGHANEKIDLKSSGSRSDRRIETDWHNKKRITTKDLKLDIHLPKDFSGEISVETISGSVDLPSGEFEDIKLETTSGSIEMTSLSAEEISIDSVSGSINAADVDSEDFVIESTSGSIDLYGNINGDLDLKSVSGTITFRGSAESLEVKTTSGRIELTIEAIEDSLNAASISGTIQIMIPEDLPAYGSIGSVSGSKDINLKTASISGGAKNLSFTTGDEDIEINAATVSGAISIREL